MGEKGSQQEAMRMEKTLPKLEEATILMYLMLVAEINRLWELSGMEQGRLTCCRV